MNSTLASFALLALLLLSGCATDTAAQYQVGRGSQATSRQSKTNAEQSYAQQASEIVLAGHDSAPQVITSRFPDYPQSWRNRGIQGLVVVHFTIDSDGSVSNPSVAGSPQPELAALVLHTILQWKFKPAIKDGKPVAVRAQQEFAFKVN